MRTEVTKVPAKKESQTIMAARRRRVAIVYNDGSTTLLLRFGDEPASLGDFSVRVASKERIGPLESAYDGTVTGCWEDGPGSPPAKPTGFARVTELLED